eukprot:92034-Prymnesium_polylepis.1
MSGLPVPTRRRFGMGLFVQIAMETWPFTSLVIASRGIGVTEAARHNARADLAYRPFYGHA